MSVPNFSHQDSSPPMPKQGQGTGGFQVKQTTKPWMQPNVGYSNPGLYQETNGNVLSDKRVSDADSPSRRLEPDFGEMEMRQQMESQASNNIGLESQPLCSMIPYSCFSDDGKFGLNRESNNQNELFAVKDDLGVINRISTGKYPLQLHHFGDNQVNNFEGYGHPLCNDQLGQHSPLIQKSTAIQQVSVPCQPSQSHSHLVENLCQVDGIKNQARWAAVSLNVDDQTHQQPKQRSVPQSAPCSYPLQTRRQNVLW